ncbi:DnaJ-class molecular chaperone with C-terminal Zn finger domain [Chloracidobacterium thermophilum B]|uniref:DnaJ-class molecular chaperone with C-terminal Zn finger domain n=2 Tax=Chloracidobacterium thermophilum TaxID=458033 RepID=G2LH98_CHLTF|nr:DnaJ-class molecular chaperone with C-terminal Zn finger domain [Chloracidobacterium thermophilum B]
MKGTLSLINFADIIRDLHLTRRTGLLRLTRDRELRAVFVEQGDLVFALSNLPHERLGDFLLARDLITREQYEAAVQKPNAKQRFGQVLVEMGVMSREAVETHARQHLTEIILAAFEWERGEFVFEEGTRAAHDVKLNLLTPNLILMGVRRMTNDEAVRRALGPTTQFIELSPDAITQLQRATLDGTEGFVLSRITGRMTIDELVLISGVPEATILRVVYGLLCAGILVGSHPRPTMANPQPAAPAAPPPATPQPVATPPTPHSIPEPEAVKPDEARFELQMFREFLSLKTTTYYDMLNVGPTASDSEIKRSYYQMAKKYHPDRYRPLGMPDVLESAEWIFARISEAYEKLRDPDVRRRYDEFIGLIPENTVQTEAKVASVTAPSPPSAPPVSKPAVGTQTGQIPTPPIPPVGAGTTGSLASSTQPVGSRTGSSSQGLGRQTGAATTGSVSAPAETAAETAARSYEMACAAIERKDFITAITYLREAVRLAPEVIRYRSRLASLCMQNPKLRKEAEDQLLAILKIDGTYVDAHLALGHMYHQAGMEKSARKQFEAALAIQPDNAVAKQMLSLLKSETEAKAAPVPPKLPTKPQTPAAKSPAKTEKPEEPKKSLLQQDVGELFGKLFKR